MLSKENAARATKEALLIKKNIALYSHKSLSDLDFNLPVDGIISSRFGKKRYINDIPRSPHMALDIAAPKGTSIFSPSDGKVVLVGDFFYGGKYALLDHGMGLLTSYSHMSEILVEEGMVINKGQEIGLVGSTGRVTGPHLHWTVYLNKERVNPELFLNKNIIKTISNF
jgi:murein DD-endopeptidase MepM/ murein hydrolase activator NlpD